MEIFAVMYEMCKSGSNGETVYFCRRFIPESVQIQLHLRHELWHRRKKILRFPSFYSALVTGEPIVMFTFSACLFPSLSLFNMSNLKKNKPFFLDFRIEVSRERNLFGLKSL